MKLLTHCPDCNYFSTEPDDVAVHLIRHHQWDYENARIWLRDIVEAA